jgi:metallo-beta-lactamase class B
MRLATTLFLLASSGLLAQRNAAERAEWNQPVKPFRIIGNVYYVGVAGISAFLVRTSQGAILLDGGLPESAPRIEKSIEELGMSIHDVKILLNSHAHLDHAGGLAELKKHSGARMIASQGDREALVQGRQIYEDSGVTPFPAVAVDRVIGDRETVELGAVTLTAHLTPGHTEGCTTWTMPVSDDRGRHNVIFYCSTSVVDKLVHNRHYPGIAADYQRTFETLHSLSADVFLAPHSSLFRWEEKRARLDAGHADAFVDAGELQRFVKSSENEFRQELAKQQAAKR